MEWINSITEGVGGLSTIIGTLGSAGIGLFGIFGIISAIDKAIKEIEDVIEHLKNKYAGDKKLKKELDEALVAIANTLEKIPFLRKHAKLIRSRISSGGLNPW